MLSKANLYIILLLCGLFEIYPQDYEFSLEHRRKRDHISVEIWVKALNSNVSAIGDSEIYLEYNTEFLSIDNFVPISSTDSISRDFYSDPYITIQSGFHNQNGFVGLQRLENNPTYSGIRARLQNSGVGGIKPSSNGKGTLFARLSFLIKNGTPANAQTGIKFSTNQVFSQKIETALGDDITSRSNFKNPSSFLINGVRLLSGVYDGDLINRGADYTGLNSNYRNYGYPIYFERSADPQRFGIPFSRRLGFLLEYNDGNGWEELGRVLEDNSPTNKNSAIFRNGSIAVPQSGSAHVISTANDQTINSNNYHMPLRTLWAPSNDNRLRSEDVQLRITMLEGPVDVNISAKEEVFNTFTSPVTNPLGNYFFIQLDGRAEYFRTKSNFSNPTQITVSAWINPDKLGSGNTGIIASSGGPNMEPINGLREGAWMLYLKDGRFPAFRSREQNGDFFIDLVAEEAVTEADYADDDVSHSQNWTHISATVFDGKASLYVNGERVDHQNGDDDNGDRMLSTNHPIWIGVNPNDGSLSNQFSGGIKEVQVWRTTLSQDSIRLFSLGIPQANNIDVNNLPNIRTSLELYYPLTQSRNDFASNEEWQNGTNVLDHYSGVNIVNNPNYLPDLPHLLISSPRSGLGLSSLQGEFYQIRYMGYGIGSVGTNSQDLDIEYSIDGGSNWVLAKQPSGATLGGDRNLNIEELEATWEPNGNNDASGNLRSADPYSKDVRLRITGHSTRNEKTIVSKETLINVSKYLSLERDSHTPLKVFDQGSSLKPTDGTFFEAWIKPYRFPEQSGDLFPIISQVDSTQSIIDYSLNLNSEGGLEFYSGQKDNLTKITTDSTFKLKRPNSIDTDTAWYHMAFYFKPEENEFELYVDGDHITSLNSVSTNTYSKIQPGNTEQFIGYTPDNEILESAGFVGAIKEIRQWNGKPFNLENGDIYSPLDLFVQGALTQRIKEYPGVDSSNLIYSFALNGSTANINGENKKIISDLDSNIYLGFTGDGPRFIATQPYIKLVNPLPEAAIRQDTRDVRIRWVGFDYDPSSITGGNIGNNPPSLEFSTKGGGGNNPVPYQYVGSRFWPGNSQNAFSVPDTNIYVFDSGNEQTPFAGSLDFSIIDPDLNDDNLAVDPGRLPVINRNVRLKLNAFVSIEGDTIRLESESGIFSTSPGTNLVVRAAFEGLHNGASKNLTQIDSTYLNGGTRIKIYEDVLGKPGQLLAIQDASTGYVSTSSGNRNFNANNWANINFRVQGLENGNYWLVLEQLSHMSVMSRYPVPFLNEGDDPNTWEIESGWDFTSWTGIDENFVPDSTYDPYNGFYYTAFGGATSLKIDSGWTTTGLAFNDGIESTLRDPIASLAAGDVNQNGAIDTLDLFENAENSGSQNIRHDLDQDGLVDAFDRTLILRNIGKVSSLGEFKTLVYSSNTPVETGIKKAIRKQEGEEFTIQTETVFEEDLIEISFFISSSGDEFKLGNSSLMFEYSDALNLLEFEQGSYFTNSDNFYRNSLGITSEIEGNKIAALEIVYFGDENSGNIVPESNVFLGKFIFEIEEGNDLFEFSWHEGTKFFKTDGTNLEFKYDLGLIEPAKNFTVDFINPQNGDVYGMGNELLIQWSNTGPDVYLELRNDLQGWSRLTDQVFSNTITEYEYQLPFTEVFNNQLRLVDAIRGTVLAQSGKFSVESLTAEILSPSATDPIYKAGDDLEIIFTSRGYKTFDIEFSSNGSDWELIYSSIDANIINVSWELPQINSSTCYIRLVDENGNIVDISGKFRVLIGELNILSPLQSQIYSNTEPVSVSWSYKDVDEIDLQADINASGNWITIARELKTYGRVYNWDAFGIISNGARIRAIVHDNPELEYDRSQLFELVDPTTGSNVDKKFKFIDLKTINRDINLGIKKSGEYSFTLFDLKGKELIAKKGYFTSCETIVLITNNLPNGIYLLGVNEPQNYTIKKLSITN